MTGPTDIVLEGRSGRSGVLARKSSRLVIAVVTVLVAIGIVAALNWSTVRPVLTSDLTLLSVGIVLSILAIIAWSLSNRAEATPNEDQVAEMHRFVNDHFAKYVARGLIAEGAGPVAISQDPAWRKVYLQHLRLHNELYPFVPPRHSWWGPIIAFVFAGPVGVAALWVIRKGVSPKVALRIFEADIDAAVRRELEALRAAGQRANPAVAS